MDTVPVPGSKAAGANPGYSAESSGLSEWIKVVNFSPNSRMIVADPGIKAVVFSIKLQAYNNQAWHTAVSYESRFGKNTRFIYKLNGTRRPMDLDLPADVIRSMAVEDFQSNWSTYIDCFLSGRTVIIDGHGSGPIKDSGLGPTN